jgi:AbrB family looped-hinge helix DNA binding protein
MNANTTLSAKGQVVIPKDVRERLKLAPGDKLEVVERPDGVLLRKRRTKSGESFEAITERIGKITNYRGPPLSLEEMDQAIAEMWATGGPRYDK